MGKTRTDQRRNCVTNFQCPSCAICISGAVRVRYLGCNGRLFSRRNSTILQISSGASWFANGVITVPRQETAIKTRIHRYRDRACGRTSRPDFNQTASKRHLPPFMYGREHNVSFEKRQAPCCRETIFFLHTCATAPTALPRRAIVAIARGQNLSAVRRDPRSHE